MSQGYKRSGGGGGVCVCVWGGGGGEGRGNMVLQSNTPLVLVHMCGAFQYTSALTAH